VAERNWIASPVAAELEGVVRAFREAGQVAQHVTLKGLLTSWSGLVEEVERGYTDSVYEYANDVDSRKILDRVADAARSDMGETLRQWLKPWDERYEAATVRASAPFHGRADADGPHAASEWHWRIPRRLEGELREDLKAIGLT
jgi:hypothetical protein